MKYKQIDNSSLKLNLQFKFRFKFNDTNFLKYLSYLVNLSVFKFSLNFSNIFILEEFRETNLFAVLVIKSASVLSLWA